MNIGIGYDFHENYVTLAMERNEALSGGRKMAKEFTVIIEQDEEGYFDRQRDYFSSEEGRICSGKAEG